MSVTPEQIEQWCQLPSEHQRLEFKEAKQTFEREKLYRYCIALANEGGGYLVLGVSDKPPRRIVGSSAFPNLVGTAEKVFEAVGFRVDVEETSHRDGRLVVFHIPSRPKGTAYHLGGTYFMRSGEQLVPISEDRLRRIFAEGLPDWLNETSRSALLPSEIVDLLDTQAYFELMKLPYPTNRNGVIERLESEQLIERDNDSDSFSIQRLGALLLAKQLSDFPDIVRKAPRVVVYSGNSKIETHLDQFGIKGYAVGFQGLLRFVASQLPQNEIIEDALRRDFKLVPEIVVRELVANALIHQDFSVSGASVMVEIYSDRLEISNPGEPIVPVERFIDGYQSRNELLADIMRRMGICEEKSSGIDKVVNAAEFYQLPAPDFRSGLDRTIVTIFGHKSFEQMDRADRVRACYQHCVLKWVMSQRMTNQSLRDRFKLPERKSASVSQVIALAVEEGAIKHDETVGSSRKYARYVPFWA